MFLFCGISPLLNTFLVTWFVKKTIVYPWGAWSIFLTFSPSRWLFVHWIFEMILDWVTMRIESLLDCSFNGCTFSSPCHFICQIRFANDFEQIVHLLLIIHLKIFCSLFVNFCCSCNFIIILTWMTAHLNCIINWSTCCSSQDPILSCCLLICWPDPTWMTSWATWWDWSIFDWFLFLVWICKHVVFTLSCRGRLG